MNQHIFFCFSCFECFSLPVWGSFSSLSGTLHNLALGSVFFFFFWWYILLFLKCGQYQISVWTHHSLGSDWMPKRDNAISHTARCHTESNTKAIEGIASSFIWKQIITRVRKIDPFNYEFWGIIAAISLGRDVKWQQRLTRILKPEFLVKEQIGRLKRAGCSLTMSKYFRDECSPLYSPLVNAWNWWTEERVNYYYSNHTETEKNLHGRSKHC